MTFDQTHLHQLKDRLPHTWDALFARFGRLTEIQAQAIEPLLEGRNCVLVSATASGKTEAALAPLLERHKQSSLSKSPNKLSILYIVPTRALARDLARRMQLPLEKLAVRMQIKTGDEPALNSNRPPELLLTTPESFDSLLANRPRMAKDINAVVIDELHIFDDSVRGDQLRILINRLHRIKRYAFERGDIVRNELQFCALSATIYNPAEVAARYFSDPLVAQVAGPRAVDAELIAMEGADTLTQLFATLKQRGRKKVLAFCTRRAECEEWAHLLGRNSLFGNHVYVHHASLEARVRRSVESRFALAEAALCFATSTLELGIDIGDVDLVMLISPPENTSAFLQRIGRGNRRTARTAVVCCYRNAIERALFKVFIRAAQSGEIEPSLTCFRPSVVVQQLCSYIKQTRLGEIDPDAAFELFSTPQGEPLIEKRRYDQIIECLLLKQYFIPARGSSLKPGPTWQELYEEQAIYTNLPDPWRGTIDVIDEMTGRKLGEVERVVAPGTTFIFQGQARRVTRRIGRKMFVRESDEGADATAPEMRTPWRPLSYTLAQAVAIELGLPRAGSTSDIAMVIESGPDTKAGASEAQGVTISQPGAWVFHCAGDTWGVVLGDLLEALYRVRVEDYSDLYMMVTGALPAEPLRFTAEQVRARVGRHWQQFESRFDLGRFQSQLPLEVRRAAVIETFDVKGFWRAFYGRKIAEIGEVETA